MRVFTLYAGAVAALLTSHFSQAAGCLLSGDTQTDTIDAGEILVQRDAPVGSVLFRKMMPATGATLGSCDTGAYSKQLQLVNLQPVPGHTDLYQSGVQGVGIRLQSGGTPLTGSTSDTQNGPATLKDEDMVTFSLIKTGPVEPGMLTHQDLLQVNYTGQDGGVVTAKRFTLAGGTVTQASCQVRTPSIVVPMGSLDKKTLKGVNSVASVRDFQIALDCNKNTNVNVTFAPLTAQGENAQRLKGVLEGDAVTGAATGVGIQMLMGGVPVEFNTLLPAGSTSADGLFSIPLQARYFQILDHITPGTINARVAFTMTYQ